MADIRIKDLPANVAPSPSQFVGTDLATTQKLTIQALVDTGAPVASQAEAEAGVNSIKRMTPLTTKQAIAAQSATTEQVAQIVAIASALSPASTHTFTVVLGQTSVGIPGGYQIGKVSEVFLSGVRISGWTASDGDNVTFPAISLEDLGGEANAELVVMVGFPTTGFTALDQRYELRTATNVKELGVMGAGEDDTIGIKAACEAGLPLIWPAGVYKTTSPIRLTTAQCWEAVGTVTIKYDGPANVAAFPVIDFVETCKLTGKFVFDQQADVKNFSAPTIYNANIIAGSAVLIQGDDSTVEEVRPLNAWDNGISIVRMDLTTGDPIVAYPTGVKVGKVRSQNCGLGTLAGAGFNLATGSSFTGGDFYDLGSYVGTAVDFAAGASGVIDNVISRQAKKSGVYLGGSGVCLSNVFIDEAGASGGPALFLDYYASLTQIGNVVIKNCYQEAIVSGSTSSTLTNITIANASIQGSGLFSAIKLTAGAENVARYFKASNVRLTGNLHKWAVEAVSSPAGQWTAVIEGEIAVGTLGYVSANGENVIVVGDDDRLRGGWTPVLQPTTGSFTSVNYDFRSALYWTVGDIVFFDFILGFTPVVGSGAGDLLISGLPFTAERDGAGQITSINERFSWPSTSTDIKGVVEAGTSVVKLVGNKSAQVTGKMQVSGLTSGQAHQLRMSGSYIRNRKY